MTLSNILFIAAALMFFVFCLAGFGAITLTHADGWLGGGFVAFALAHIPPRP